MNVPESLLNEDRFTEAVKAIMERISELWSAYYGSYISPMQVSLMQLLVKVSRLSETPNHKDSVKDIIGYATIYQELFDSYDKDYGVNDGYKSE
jgi:hypothetical protein